MSFFPCCQEVGTPGDDVTHTIINIGFGARWYVIGTGPDPFEFRTATSADGSVTIAMGASEVDFSVDFGANVSLANVGGGAEVWIDPSENPFKLRTNVSSDGSVAITQFVETLDFVVDFGGNVSIINVGGFAEWFKVGTENPFELKTAQSSDGSVTITVNADDIDLTVPVASGAEVFQVDDDTSTVSTTSTTYQQLAILATDPLTQIKDGEEWKLNLCVFVCHPVNVFTVNTWVRWSIETAAGVFTPVDEWQINGPIIIQVGEPSMPFHRTRNVTIAFDDPRMKVEIRMSAVQASATFAEDPRWGGVQIAPAP